MIVYIPGARVREMSELLWRQLGADRDGSMFPVKTMTDGSTWMMVETTASIAVSQYAELDGMADLLQPYVDAGELPASALTDLDALIQSKRGQMLVLWEAFPALFQNAAQTGAQLGAAGLLHFMEGGAA